MDGSKITMVRALDLPSGKGVFKINWMCTLGQHPVWLESGIAKRSEHVAYLW